MPVTVTIVGDSTEHVRALFSRMFGTAPVPTPAAEAPAPKVEKAKPAKAAKESQAEATKPAEPQPEPPKEPEKPVEPKPEPEKVADVAAPSLEDVRAALQALIASPGGEAKARALLDKYGAKKVSEIPEEKRGEFLGAAKKEMAG